MGSAYFWVLLYIIQANTGFCTRIVVIITKFYGQTNRKYHITVIELHGMFITFVGTGNNVLNGIYLLYNTYICIYMYIYIYIYMQAQTWG